MTTLQRKLWAGLIIMVLLSPLGVIIPEIFKAGDAWGEWGAETLAKLLGYIPEGLKQYTGLWKAPIPDYSLGGDNASQWLQIASPILSGLLGIAIVALVVYLLAKFVVRHDG